uniref:Putative secreted protein n=1 Tax=Anopheles darlingi TaxID=43151 RepID=A0A2M4D7W6_ANODA
MVATLVVGTAAGSRADRTNGSASSDAFRSLTIAFGRLRMDLMSGAQHLPSGMSCCCCCCCCWARNKSR